jgi:hypothetical protein
MRRRIHPGVQPGRSVGRNFDTANRRMNPAHQRIPGGAYARILLPRGIAIRMPVRHVLLRPRFLLAGVSRHPQLGLHDPRLGDNRGHRLTPSLGIQ